MSPGEEIRDYYRIQGQLSEQIRWIKRLNQNICYECNHPSCNDLREIIQDCETLQSYVQKEIDKL